MQKLIFLTAFVFLGLSSYAQSSTDNILGKWVIDDQNRVLEFVENGQTYEALIVEAEGEFEQYIGKKQITGLQYKKGNDFKDGTLHILKKGDEADCSVRLISETKMELKVSYGFISKTQSLTKL